MTTDPNKATGDGEARRVIRKAYMSIAQAERAQNKLYGKFNSVKLIESPKFQQSGWYAWEVSGEYGS